jgi:hypothetical protein
MVTNEFTEDIIKLLEIFNRWSGSGHNVSFDSTLLTIKLIFDLILQDRRLAGGYENVPTDDIHMTQVDFNDHWLFILQDIIQPIQRKLYSGYFSDVS